jgi:outer membrane protein assembly factor BamB
MSRQTIQLPQLDGQRRQEWRIAAGRIGIIAAVFCLIVAGVLLVQLVRDVVEHPLAAFEFVQNQERLADSPDDEALRTALRNEDLLLRERYFRRRALVAHGAWLLLGGAVVLGASVKVHAKLSEKPPMPDPSGPAASSSASTARWAVVCGTFFLGGILLGVALVPQAPRIMVSGGGTAADPGDAQGAAAPAPAVVTVEQLKRNWTAFRGYGGSATAAPGQYPTSWDIPSKQNVLWQVELPIPGRSSPIVFEDRLFLTAATGTRREVLCFDVKTGSLLWRGVVSQSARPLPEDLNEEEVTYAPNTPATDGHRIYAIYPSGDIAAFDFTGRRLWVRNVGIPENVYGHSASLLTWKDRVIVQIDQGHVKNETSRSAIFALDGPSGRELWRMQRPVESSWTSPTLIETKNGEQIIAVGHPWVMAYNPEDGREIWRAKGLGGEVAPSAAYADGIVYAGVERADLLAIPTDRTGDVTSAILWEQPENTPDVVSPVVAGAHVYMISPGGRIGCVNIKDGQIAWEHEFEEERFDASPILAGGLVYLFEREKGDVILFRPGDKYEQAARLSMGEPIHATPAFVNGRIYVRGEKHLFCIGE